MTEQQKPARKPRPRPSVTVPKPEWADGLRNIYDAVVNEPLPPDMLALLASLDAAEEGEGTTDTDDDREKGR